MQEIYIKIIFIEGLKDIVLSELKKYPEIVIKESSENSIYMENKTESLPIILNLKSITRAFLVRRDKSLNPKYISNHKSMLGELIQVVLQNGKFSTYSLSCAGKGTTELKEITTYIEKQFKLTLNEIADMKIYIGKNTSVWEIGAELTPKPLSQRTYREINLEGAIDPTIAFAVNAFCKLDDNNNYLNIFSGSATLLIEAANINENLNYIGFDNDKKRTSAAIQNIKKAKLIKKIKLHVLDIFDSPDLKKFDNIVSDLPFGMRIGKKQELSQLYTAFINYCEHHINPDGVLVVYTTEHELFSSLIKKSNLKIEKTLSLKIISSVESYLYPKIFVCGLNKK